MLGRSHRKPALLAVPVVVCAGFIALTLRSTVATAAPHLSAAAKPVSTARSTPAATVIRSPAVRTVRSILTLPAPAVDKHTTWAAFVLDGPARLVRTEMKAPFALRLDTRQVPNGRYTLTTITHFHDRAPTIVVAGIVVANSQQTPTPSAHPTTAPLTTARPASPGITPPASPKPSATPPPAPPASAPVTVPPPTTAPAQPDLPTVTATRPLKF